MGLGSSKIKIATRLRAKKHLGPRCYRIKTKCLRATLKAIMVDIPGRGTFQSWIPSVVIHPSSQVQRPGDEGELVVLWWFARKKGWVSG